MLTLTLIDGFAKIALKDITSPTKTLKKGISPTASLVILKTVTFVTWDEMILTNAMYAQKTIFLTTEGTLALSRFLIVRLIQRTTTIMEKSGSVLNV